MRKAMLIPVAAAAAARGRLRRQDGGRRASPRRSRHQQGGRLDDDQPVRGGSQLRPQDAQGRGEGRPRAPRREKKCHNQPDADGCQEYSGYRAGDGD